MKNYLVSLALLGSAKASEGFLQWIDGDFDKTDLDDQIP